MNLLNKEDGLYLKGIAIICIVLHNFIRVIESVECNEFAFHQDSVNYMLENLATKPFFVICSFWGWLGVPLFVFISGYGLQLKYKKTISNDVNYVFEHFLKLFFLLLPAYLIYVTYVKLVTPDIDYGKVLVLQHLSLVINILNPKFINPGVYWYLGLAFQLYILFLVLRNCPNFVLYTLVLGGIVILQILVLNEQQIGLTYIRHNSIGWLHVFSMGILFARYDFDTSFIKIKNVIISLPLVAFIFLCSLSPMGWPMIEFSAVFAFLILLPVFRKLSLLRIIGIISASLYVVHPVTRIVWKHCVKLEYSNQIAVIGSAFIFLCLTFILSWLYSYYFDNIMIRLIVKK